MFKTARLALLSTITLSLASCATIVHGPHQMMSISSNPSDANVYVDQFFVGKTPALVRLTRNDNHMLRIELDGFQPYERIITKQLSGWVFGNLLFGGIFGLAIDAISGSVYKLTPDQVHAQLRENTVCSTQSDDSFIFIVLEADPTWEKVGNMVANN